MTPVSSIIRQATREPGEPYNCITGIAHERYESGLAKANANFYAFGHKSFKPYWNESFAAIPENYHVLKPETLPSHVKFDFVLSHNKFGQYQVLSQIARKLHLPLISLEHTLPYTGWKEEVVDNCRNMRGDINVFISDYSIGQWKWQRDATTKVIHHGLDTNQFSPDDRQKEKHVLSVVNDWQNRDWCCGYKAWTRIIHGLPYKVLGDTVGLSKPAKDTQDLIDHYRSAGVFLNTSTISPVPMALMEAMACGCAVVSTATCMIPEIITSGENGFISNSEKALKGYLQLLLENDDLRNKMGAAARQTILDRFGLDSFVNNWNTIFDVAANIGYRG